jgi:peptidoglycan hydrolase-like protein with peptidoglycan-binding domain
MSRSSYHRLSLAHQYHYPRGRRSSYRSRHRRWGWLHRSAPASGLSPSPTVTWAQGCLAQLLGPWVPQDGVMGPGTQQAIQQFQTQQQLPPTGMLDDNTVSVLQTACSGQPTAQDSAGAFPAAPPAAPPPMPPPALAQQPTPPPSAARRHHAPNPAGGNTPEMEGELALGRGQPEEHRHVGRWIYDQRGRIVVLDV